MRIGEVHAELRKDFPDIELSKIRYYEDKGLVQPSRSRKGYRLYSERDLACLREAIRLANEEFVPLRVVRVRLIEQGLLPDAPITPSTRNAAREAKNRAVSIPAPEPRIPTPRPVLSLVEVTQSRDDADGLDEARYFSADEFLATTGLDARLFSQLQSLGVLVPMVEARRMVFTDADVRIAVLASELVARGVDPRLLGSVRRVVDRAVGVIDEMTQPLRARGSGVTAEQARLITAEVATQVGELRDILLTRAVADYLNN